MNNPIGIPSGWEERAARAAFAGSVWLLAKSYWPANNRIMSFWRVQANHDWRVED